MNDIVIYSIGIGSMSVCASNSIDVPSVEAKANKRHPTGIISQWKVAKDKHFLGGEPMPCPCNTYPEDRQHWLLHC